MLSWILGVSLKDKRRSEDIRHELRVACISMTKCVALDYDGRATWSGEGEGITTAQYEL